MALETATYINGLVSSNPPGTDQISQADDHLRLIKATVLATFPNITGAVTATHSAINTAAVLGTVTPAADTLPYYTGTSTATTTALTAAARSFLGQTSIANMVTYLGVSSASNTAFTNAANTFTGIQSITSGSANQLSLNDTSGNAQHIALKQTGVIKGYLGATSTYAFYASNASGLLPIYSDQSGNFTASGNVTSSSDIRLKKNIETISDALDIVSELRGVWYTRVDTGADRVGVIAQEIDEVLPEVVLENPETGYLSVSYGDIVGVLIEAIKELKTRVEELESR